jgi:hypothetical protein
LAHVPLGGRGFGFGGPRLQKNQRTQNKLGRPAKTKPKKSTKKVRHTERDKNKGKEKKKTKQEKKE